MAQEAARFVPREIVVLRDEEAARGMGQSIAAVSARADAPGWLAPPATCRWSSLPPC
jgi:hypothetical protein